MRANIHLTILLLLVACATSAQSLSLGTYGAYLDASTFAELTLNKDQSFQYLDQFELGSPVKCKGIWNVEGRKLQLTPCAENSTRPMPRKWRIRNAELISKKVRNGTGVKMRKVLRLEKILLT